jgi:hypothetical protein
MIFFNLPSVIASKIDLSEYTVREKIEIVEWYLHKAVKNIISELEVNEYIKDGYYFRQIMIPKGVLLTGKIHLKGHLFVVLDGDMELATDDFSERVRADIQRPFVAVIPDNSKKIGYAYENTIVATFHKIDDECANIDKINDKILADSDLTWVDALMSEYGITEEDIMRLEQIGDVA